MLLILRKYHDFLAVVEIMYIKTLVHQDKAEQWGQSLKNEEPGLRLG